MKLYKYCDSWVHGFHYTGDNFPAAVFRCDRKVSAWGLEWMQQPEGTAIVCPKLSFKDKVNMTKGLAVLEVQGLDNSTVLVIVEETVPKGEETRTYGLILDYRTMDLVMCESITSQGMLDKPDGERFWTPVEMKNEWDIIDEARRENRPAADAAPSPPAKPSAKKTAKKRKATAGGPGDAVVAEPVVKGKGKKTKVVELTIHKAVNMTDAEVGKLAPEEIKEINKLYTKVFKPMYRWEKKPLANAKGELLRVHYRFLHKAPAGVLVYRGIEASRLKGIKNQILVDPDYHSEKRYITVLPLRAGPYGEKNLVKYWDVVPKKESLTAKTHYYIIGGQHTVEAHRHLVEQGHIPEADKEAASTFNIIPIWENFDSKKNEIMHLSKSLNQNIAGEQREQSFSQQLAHARLKWRDMNSPMPSFGGRAHSAEYNVS